MSKSKWIATIAFLFAATFGVSVWYFAQLPAPANSNIGGTFRKPILNTVNSNTTVAHEKLTESPSIAGSSALPKSTRQESVAKPPTSPWRSRFNGKEPFAVLYAELSASADNDPQAKYYLAQILQTCMNALSISRNANRFIGDASPAKARRYETLGEMTERCAGVDVENTRVAPMDLMRDAAAKGDLPSQAFAMRFQGIGIGEANLQNTQKARGLAGSNDPTVLDNLDGYFLARNKILVWSIPGVEGPVSGLEMALASNIAACELGIDCSSSSVAAKLTCISKGWCDDGGRVAQIRNNLAAPNQFARLETIKDVFLMGLATGSWPPGFWSGSDGSSPKR